ncbi:MAG: DUF2842 domain-containing protein [Defluviimonas denitrificans]
MSLSYTARRRWSLVILLIGLPLYIMLAVSVIGWISMIFGRPPFLAEIAVYVVLGVLWALPFRFVFRGVGKEDPDMQEGRPEDRP